MFYVLNTKNNLKNNDPYKISMKNLVNEIKSMDLGKLKEINEGFGDTSMDNIVTFAVNNTDEVTVKSLEKKMKAILKEFSIEELYYMYIASLSDLLTDEFIIESARMQGVNLEESTDAYDEAMRNLVLKSLIGTVCIFVIVLREQLLERQLETISIEDDYNKSRIVKSLRKNNYSLYKGVRNLPILMSEKEAELIEGLSKKILADGFDQNVVTHAGVMYSYRALEVLIAKYCFGDKVHEYVDIREFIGKEAFSISETKLFIAPAQIFTARKNLPAEEGVVLRPTNHKNIDGIYLAECSRFNYRIIYGVVRYKNGMECPISLRMNYNSTVTLSCYDVVDVMTIILDYYKIEGEVLECLGEIPPASEYEIISGLYWPLRKVGYETEAEKQQRESGKKVKREYSVKAGTYVRKIKGVASDEANKFASKLRIALGEGTTLIKEKDRKYFREIEELGFE